MPIPVQRFSFVAIGGEVQLDAGYTDLVDLKRGLDALRSPQKQRGKGSEPDAVEFHVAARMVLTPEAAINLLDTATKIIAHLEKAGLLVKETHEGAENALGDGTTDSD